MKKAITDKERLDFAERNPSAIGIARQFVLGYPDGRTEEWVDIRAKIDKAIELARGLHEEAWNE